MSWSRILAQAELDLPPLVRRKRALLDRLAVLEQSTDPQQRKDLAWQLSLDFPGLGCIGELVNLTALDLHRIMLGLPVDDPAKQFVKELVARISNKPALYAALGQAMPHSFPPPRLPGPDIPPPPRDIAGSMTRTAPSAASPSPALPPSPDSPARTPLPPLLSRLVVRLCRGKLQPSLTLADSVKGYFAQEVPDLRLQLQLRDDGSITATAINQPDVPVRERNDGFIRPIRDQAELELADGSHLYGEMFGITSEEHKVDGHTLERSWHGTLRSWYWWKQEEVRYWVARSHAYFPRPIWNLDIEYRYGDRHGGSIGHFHLAGTPSVTVVSINSDHKKGDQGEPAAIVIESLHHGHDDKQMLKQLCVMLQSVLSIPMPTIFYGYNDQAVLCAALQISHPGSKVQHLAVPGAPCNFIPCLSGDSLKEHRVWMAPFLHRLRTDAQRRVSQTMDSLGFFRWVTEEPVFEFQIEKLGKAIRILLHSEGVLRHDDYLSPARVSQVLRSFAKTRGVRLPAGTEAALELSHRLALLGGRGVEPSRLSSSLDVRQADEARRVLRTAYASLIAGLLGYTGPLFWKMDAARSGSEVHHALLHPNPADERLDQAAAEERFVVSEDEPTEPESEPDAIQRGT